MAPERSAAPGGGTTVATFARARRYPTVSTRTAWTGHSIVEAGGMSLPGNRNEQPAAAKAKTKAQKLVERTCNGRMGRSYTRPAGRAAQSAARRTAFNAHLCNFLDEIRIEVAALLRRPGQVLPLGQVRVGVRLDDVDGVVVGQTHVDAAVIAQPSGFVGPQRHLSQTMPQLIREVLGDHVLDPAPFAVADAPFGLEGGDSALDRGIVPEYHLDWRQRDRGIVPHDADVELAPRDELLDDRVGLDALMNESDAFLERVVARDHRGLRDANRRVLVQRLDDQREPEIAGSLNRIAAVADHEVRDPDALVGEHLLGERLVPRQHEPFGRRARIGKAQYIEYRRDRVVQRGLAAKAFRQIEDDVGRLGAQARDQLIQVVAEAEHPDLVPLRDQRARDVELGLVGRLDLLLIVLRRGRVAVRVEENEQPRFLHALP